MTRLAHAIRRNAIGLGLFAVITGGVIAVTQAITKERIQQQVARAESGALLEIIPEHTHNNNLLEDTIQLPVSGTLANDTPVTAWVARLDQKPVGLIMPIVAPDGYSGNIRLLVGLDMHGTVLGVRVTGHKETPGLGDRIETKKSDWVKGFDGHSLGNPPYPVWNVKKNGGMFDQFTGATITPRAIVKAVQRALVYFHENRNGILRLLDTSPHLRDIPLVPETMAGDFIPSEHS
jgi:electron transport complex protein RnfG